MSAFSGEVPPPDDSACLDSRTRPHHPFSLRFWLVCVFSDQGCFGQESKPCFAEERMKWAGYPRMRLDQDGRNRWQRRTLGARLPESRWKQMSTQRQLVCRTLNTWPWAQENSALPWLGHLERAAQPLWEISSSLPEPDVVRVGWNHIL